MSALERDGPAQSTSHLQIELPELLKHWKVLLAGPLILAALAGAGSYLVAPLYTARTLFVPPQQSSSPTASALASLGALSGLAGNVAGLKSTADQYVSLLQSANVADRIIDRFELIKVYDVEKRAYALMKLQQRVRVSLGRKDGLITIEVDDQDPKRAAEMANQHVGELRRLSTSLALTETQQRRAFFEGELKRTQAALISAQAKLQGSGFNAAAIKAEPRAAAESYARLKAEATAAEVRLRTLRSQLTESAPEVRTQQASTQALLDQLRQLETAASTAGGSDYLGLYREFKYNETLFEMLSRQFEVARLDEAREGALIQVVDVATPPELKSYPRRLYFALAGAAVGLLLAAAWTLFRLPRRSISSTSL